MTDWPLNLPLPPSLPTLHNFIYQYQFMISQSQQEALSRSSRRSHSNLRFVYKPTKIISRQIKSGINRGKCKIYMSPCGFYENHIKRRMLVHIGRCGNCRQHLQHNTIHRQIPSEMHMRQHNITNTDVLQEQINKLNQQMELIKKDLANSNKNRISSRMLEDLQADQLALHIFRRNKTQIEQIIIKKMAIVISEARKCMINIENNLMIFGQKVVNQIRKISLDNCAQDCKTNLTKAHKQLIKHNFHIKTKQRYQNCYKFILKYSEIELKTFANLFEDFLKLTPTKKKYLRIYWQNIKKINPFFSSFPQLPQLREQKIQRMNNSADITLEKAAKRLLHLLTQNKLQLLCDIWLLLLLGLRFGDLLKVKLYNKEKKYYKFIRLVENKNKNLAVRFIPKSLSILCAYTQAVYPLSALRLRTAVRYCLQHFKCAYGFKHKVISYIVAVFNQQSAFGKFHKSSSTTSRFYIDQNCEFLLNSVFKFPIQLSISQQQKNEIQNRTLILDLTEKVQKDISIAEDESENQIIIDDGVDIMERMSILNLDGIPGQIQSQLQVSISQNHHLQLSQRNHDHLGSAILSINQQNLVEDIQQRLSMKSEVFSDMQVLEELSRISHRSIYYYQQSDNIIEQKFVQKQRSQEIQIVIAKNKKNKYQIAQIPIPSIRQSKKKAISRLNIKKVDPYKLLCRQCKANGIFARLCTDKYCVKCSYCDFISSENRQQRPYKTSLYIEWTGNKQHNYWPLIASRQKDSKTTNKIKEDFPDAFKTSHLYCQDFPQRIKISLPFINQRLQQQLEKGLDVQAELPLRISKSTLPNAGNGVFTTQRIARNSLLCVYRCLMGTSYSINSSLDSNFTIGWMEQSNQRPTQLLADGVTNAGIARYINSRSDSQSNCKALIGVTASQIYIFIVTKEHDIQSGSEIFYDYGDKYIFQNELSTQISDD